MKIERARLLLACVSTCALTSTAHAADWPMVQGTEAPDAPAVRPFGVVQVTASPRPTVRRARPGLRGALPGTDGRVSYYLTAELGTAPIARDGPTLADASITLGYIPGARVRIGQFRLPLMDEGVESNAQAAEWINLSLPASALVMEDPVRNGRFSGGASGFRDVGVEVFDTYQRGHVALSYALALSNGQRRSFDANDTKDITARTTASWVFSGDVTDPHRQELSLFAWGQRGERTLDGVPTQRIRSGVGVHLEKEPLRVRAELVHASGALSVGQRAIGGTVQARARVFGRARVGLRYDAVRASKSLAPMLEYDVVPRVRLQATYEKRWLSLPDGDRLGAQVTVIF
ncbi:MAG: hypothetical protein KIT84_18680 [Labilithrix sp.]|nr:hypothetical protein [Labilithrix sp.]MCW5813060.1 hypothetical protein [Labilithrix sp.]